MTDKVTQQLIDGLTAFIHFIESAKHSDEPYSDEWLEQIHGAGVALKEISQMDIGERKKVREAIAGGQNELVAFYFKVKDAFPELVDNKEEQSAYFYENFVSACDTLFEVFDDHVCTMTDDTFDLMKRKFGKKPTYELAIEMADFMNKNYSEILSEEVKSGEDRFLAWQKMRQYLLRVLFAFSLIDAGMNGGKTTAGDVARQMETLKSFEETARKGADHLFESNLAQDWIKREFHNNFKSKIKEMLDDAEKGLRNLAIWMLDRWWEATGTSKTNYKMIALRAHIEKDIKHFTLRIAGYKNFEPKKCVVAENLFPEGVQGAAVDVCIVMFNPSDPDASYDVDVSPILESLKRFAAETTIPDGNFCGQTWSGKVAESMKPRNIKNRTINPLLLFVNSVPCVDRTRKDPAQVEGYEYQKRDIIADLSGFTDGTRSTELIAYANYRDRVTIKTMFTVLYY